jgi:hypothetical protein
MRLRGLSQRDFQKPTPCSNTIPKQQHHQAQKAKRFDQTEGQACNAADHTGKEDAVWKEST